MSPILNSRVANMCFPVFVFMIQKWCSIARRYYRLFWFLHYRRKLKKNWTFFTCHFFVLVALISNLKDEAYCNIFSIFLCIACIVSFSSEKSNARWYPIYSEQYQPEDTCTSLGNGLILWYFEPALQVLSQGQTKCVFATFADCSVRQKITATCR